MPLQGAIVVCHAAGKGRDSQVWGSGAIVVCCGWGEEDDQLWGSGAIAGCHCSWGEGRVTTNFGVVDVVPLLGAHTQQWHPDKLP